MEKLARSRLARITLALAFIGAGLWAFMPYVTHRVASSAFINAELVRITAPIGGQLNQDVPRIGVVMPETSSFELVAANAPDRRQLVTLEQQLETARARADLAQRQLDEIATASRELDGRIESHRDAMLNRLARETDEVTAELAACTADETERRKARHRVDQLVKSGIASQRNADEAEAAHESTFSRCRGIEARIKRIRIEVNAAEQGIFLQDGFNDAPYSQQQRDRLLLRRQELEAELLRERSRIAQLGTEIGEEQDRVGRLSRAIVTLPRGHVVWTLSASPGSAVVEGQPVLDLADCSKRFVVVEVPERDFEETQTGDSVSVRLVGSDEWIAGWVQQARGSAARAEKRLLAAQIPSPSPRHVTVEVALPPEALSKDGRRFCHIGRMAEVRFDRHRLEVVDRAAGWMRELSQKLGLDRLQLVSGR